MRLINVIDLEEFRYGVTRAIREHSWLWMVSLIVAGAYGIAAHPRHAAMVRFPLDCWARVDTEAQRLRAEAGDAEQR